MNKKELLKHVFYGNHFSTYRPFYLQTRIFINTMKEAFLFSKIYLPGGLMSFHPVLNMT